MFVSVPDIGEPDPLFAIPVRFDVLSLIQLNNVPPKLFGLLITILLIAEPEQIV